MLRAEEVEGTVLPRRRPPGVFLPDEEHQPAQEYGDAEAGNDQPKAADLGADRCDCQPLLGDGHRGHDEHGERDGEGQGDAVGRHDGSDHPADHDVFTGGEVEDASDLGDDHQAESHGCIDAPDRETREEVLEVLVH